jgi:hypothetical protein
VIRVNHYHISTEDHIQFTCFVDSTGFQLVVDDIVRRESDLRIEDLPPKFQGMDPDDIQLAMFSFTRRGYTEVRMFRASGGRGSNLRQARTLAVVDMVLLATAPNTGLKALHVEVYS